MLRSPFIIAVSAWPLAVVSVVQSPPARILSASAS
jgi:hypothetical protein